RMFADHAIRLSYDDFHERKNSIYRIQQDRYDKGELSTRWAAGCAGIGVDMKAEFPEVKHYVRMYSDEGILANNEVVFKEENLSFASEDFFSVFSFPLKEGVDSLVLRDPFKIVISESLSEKYFGTDNPVGRILRMNGKTDFEVTGVFEDLPVNTHMKFDALLSFSSLYTLWDDPVTSWVWDGFKTYI